MKRRIVLLAAPLVIAAVVGLGAGSEFLVDWLWFRSLGLGSVFSTLWGAWVVTFAVVAIASWLILICNGLLAAHAAGPSVRRLRLVRAADDATRLPEVLEISLEYIPWRAIVLAGASVVSVGLGLAYAARWEDVLKWWYGTAFERQDPLFGRDLSFYLFTLPVYRAVCGWGSLIVVLSAIAAPTVYWGRGAVELGQGAAPPAAGSDTAPLGAFGRLLPYQGR